MPLYMSVKDNMHAMKRINGMWTLLHRISMQRKDVLMQFWDHIWYIIYKFELRSFKNKIEEVY